MYKRMLGLSKVKGSQSGKVKGDVVRKLMVQARGEEVRFLVRSLVGNLRVSCLKLIGVEHKLTSRLVLSAWYALMVISLI